MYLVSLFVPLCVKFNIQLNIQEPSEHSHTDYTYATKNNIRNHPSIGCISSHIRIKNMVAPRIILYVILTLTLPMYSESHHGDEEQRDTIG